MPQPVRSGSSQPVTRVTRNIADPRLPTGNDFNDIPFDGLRYEQIEGDIFVGATRSTDVIQGNLGDCFFLSSLVAVQKTHPELIKNAIQKNRDGSATVRLHVFKRTGTEPVDIAVDRDFPVTRTGRQTFARGRDRNHNGAELWPAYFEKAFATLQTGYSVIDQGGYAEHALFTLTGRRAQRYETHELSKERLWEILKDAKNDGRPMVTGSPSGATLKRRLGRRDMDGMIEGHAYAVTNVREYQGKRYVEVYTPLSPKDGGNPAGGQKRIREYTFDEYLKRFDDLVVGRV